MVKVVVTFVLVSVSLLYSQEIKLKSEDGNLELAINGRYIGKAIFKEGSFTTTGYSEKDTFENQQERIEVVGTFFKDFGFKVQPDFTSGTSLKLKDAWISFKRWKELHIKIGQFKQGFGLEQMISRRFIPMIERANIDNLTIGRDIGLQFSGKLLEDTLEYQAGVYNGAGYNKSDTDEVKDIALRVVLTPFKKESEPLLQGLRLELASARGSRYGDANDAHDIKTKDTGTRIVDFDPGVDYRGDYDRSNIALGWLYESIYFFAEYIRAEFGLREGAVAESGLVMDGFNVAAGVWLTGEKATWKRPKVLNPITKEGGSGALQFVARYQEFDVDDDIFKLGFASSAGTTEKATGWTVGLNWWPISHVRLSVNYVTEKYKDTLTFGPKKVEDEKAVLFRFQVDW